MFEGRIPLELRGRMPVTGPRLKVIRRLGTPLPGLTRKDAEPKASNGPAARSPSARPRKKSAYRIRLEEKQKLRWHYGVSERQLRNYFEDAARQPGPTGENLLALLERRLDSVVFRLGFAPTIRAARQLVSHGHIRVDGRRVDRAAYLVTQGQAIVVSDRAQKIEDVIVAVERGPEVKLPSFLWLNPDFRFAGLVSGTPARADVPFIVDEAAIVEFYAR
jgi:small subunit ribosomal protein S4